MMTIFEKFTQRDKLLHLIVGMVIALIAVRFELYLPFIYSLLAGILKELYDGITKDSSKYISFADCFYTALGGAIVQLIIFV